MIGPGFLVPALAPRLRRHAIGSTQRLLGETIALPEAEWQSPSLLPGWTKAHVATHLASHALSLVAVAERVSQGQRQPAWAVSDPRVDIEAGSQRDALALQVDLDTTAGQLNRALDVFEPEHWAAALATPLGPLPAIALPMARLNEVVLHHVDLGCGLTMADLDLEVAQWLLAWNALRLQPRFIGFRLRLLSDEGFDETLGAGSRLVEVRGSTTGLLGWLTGRLDGSAVLGADSVQLGPTA
ncbi:MAG: maleylpyruvate isomerase family mycothiol-dependent enzyme [Propionibacteriaceae bacterium]|nr:maleylpyruvate isomerase family mycothiol-dependent enzyme [Propionibacteriaceae bacterium]